MDKYSKTFRKYESKLDRKAKMAERNELRETRERARLNTDTDYMLSDDSIEDMDWYEENQY